MNVLQDELTWAATWLHRATNDENYLDIVFANSAKSGTRTTFSWDDKFVGAQVLAAKVN